MTTEWLDRGLYPFAPHFAQLEAGRMHYVDEGAGAPVLLVHGTPTWSFMYRDLIRQLAPLQRCVAPDNLGFGLSDKPEGADYSPEAHARNLHTFVEHLGLDEITLVVHDYGGPIGLSYALEHPEKIARLVIFNTFLWPMSGEFAPPALGRVLAGPVGRLLYRRLHFSPRAIVPVAWHNKATFTPAVRRHYEQVHRTPAQRTALWALARALYASQPWYESLWQRRERLRDIPALLLWGLRDPAFGPRFLARWRELLPEAQVRTFEDAGHFVMEEQPAAAAEAVRAFLSETAPAGRS
jgi:haloalkane dehalogenase